MAFLSPFLVIFLINSSFKFWCSPVYHFLYFMLSAFFGCSRSWKYSVFSFLNSLIKVYNQSQINYCISCEVGYQSLFFSVEIYSCSSTIYGKDFLFLIEFALISLLKINWAYVCGSISRLYFCLWSIGPSLCQHYTLNVALYSKSSNLVV